MVNTILIAALAWLGSANAAPLLQGRSTSSATTSYLSMDRQWKTLSMNTSTNYRSDATLPDMIRGVNIGGWLVLEEWMTPDIFNGTNSTDQYTFDSDSIAPESIRKHWDTYFTKSDVAKIASWGLNAMRIPIGYWAYDNDTTPYLRGSDEYMEKAIDWAREYGLKVLVDCHGSPGSQNGFDNSGRAGAAKWQSDGNLEKSISVLETMARKYGSEQYSDVVFGLELVNEPISWGANNFTITQEWAQSAYARVRAAATNKDLMIIMHDSFTTPYAWEDVGSTLNKDAALADARFAIDTHLYQNQEASDSTLTQDQHITKACNWSTSALLPSSSNLPVYVGEFSAQTNICANPDGSTLAGSACYIDGCQCSSNVPIENWNKPLIEATRKFLEAQLDVFEKSSRGWFIWSYKGPGSWGLSNLVEYGVLGKTVEERMFPGQCGA